MDERPRQLVWVVLIGLILRALLGLVFLSERMDPWREHYKFDYEVGEVAASIASGHGFNDPYPYFARSGPSALVPPVYPLLLAGIFKVFGVYSLASALVALFINNIFSALTAVPLYGIARHCFSSRVGLWSAWLWAFFPYSIYWAAPFPWVTTLTTLLLTVLVLYALRLESVTSLQAWLGFGLLAGFAVLADPSVLAVLPFVAAWPCYRNASRAANWKFSAAVAAMGMIVVPAPWVVRNLMVFRQPVFLRDGFWLSFRVGNSPGAVHWTDDDLDPSQNESEVKEMARVGEAAYMEEKRHDSLVILREHPDIFVVRSLRRFVYLWTGFWSFRSDYLALEPFDPANIPFATGFTLLALLGMRRMFRERHPERWLFVLIWLTFPAVYYFTRPLLRYRDPVDPEIVLLSVYAVMPHIDAWRKSHRKKRESMPESSRLVTAGAKMAQTGGSSLVSSWRDCALVRGSAGRAA